MISKIERNLLQLVSGRSRLLIFSFHRVLPARDELLPDEPDGALFRRKLGWIRDYCEVLPLAEAVEGLKSGNLPPGAASITFDDGYANNLAIAKPILAEFGLPATIFIAVNAIETGIMWNDIVIEAVRGMNQSLRFSESEFCLKPEHLCSRKTLIPALIDQLKYLPLSEREEKARRLFHENVGGALPRLMMTTQSLAEFSDSNIDLGAHTVHHPILSTLPDREARREIEESRQWLKRVTGKEPKLFAYPNGRLGQDYDRKHAEMVREAGFLGAVSTDWGAASNRSSLYGLPRFTPWEQTRRGFYSRLFKIYIQSWV